MKIWKSREWYLLMAVTFCVFGFNLSRTITHQNSTSLDFANYAQFVEPMKLHGTITKPHFVYPALVAAASIVFPGISYSGLGAGIVLAFQLLLASLLWKFWKEMLPAIAPKFTPFALTIAAMIVAPVNFLTLPSHDLYFGYIAITTYHNPPILICRPVALLHFMIFATVLAGGARSARRTVLCAATITLSTLMKPNYALIAEPAAIIFAAIAMSKKDLRLVKFIFLGTVLPGILILAWQYFFTFLSPNSEEGSSHIICAPFAVYEVLSQNIFSKFFLSALFPFSVLILSWKQVLRDRYYLFGLLLFGFGAAQSYLLAESGARLFNGNFLWSAQLGLFLLFLASMRAAGLRIFERVGAWKQIPNVALIVAFALHVGSGILWYLLETRAPGEFW
jgi:hypothetical protein